MSEARKKYPVIGSLALDAQPRCNESTHIISFPVKAHYAETHTPEITGNMVDLVAISNECRTALFNGEMTRTLREGTCKGKPVGGLTSIQAAGAALFTFVFFMGMLLFM